MYRVFVTICCATLLTQATAGPERIPFWDHLARSTDLITDRGSRLKMLLLDVNGDGQQDIFIAPESMCGTGGCDWSAYSPTGHPNEVRYLGQAAFDAGTFRFDPRTRTLRSCGHLSAESCAMAEYTFGATSMTRSDRGECKSGVPSCEQELHAIQTWQATNHPSLFEATITVKDVVTGLRWTLRSSGAASSPPNLDQTTVIPSSRK